MKITLMLLALLMGAAVYAGTCKNCGGNTNDEISVYRCNNCKTYFCDRCKETGRQTMISPLEYETEIFCPNCNTGDILRKDIFRTRLMKHNIRYVN